MSYGSVRSGASNDEAEAYFLTAPPPIDLAKTEEDLKEFVARHKAEGNPVVVVTAGGTTVPLERNTVRFIDNFSAGTRGALSAEHLMQHNYAVIWLHRQHCQQPFTNHFSHTVNNFMQYLQVHDDGTVHVEGKPEAITQLKGLLELHKAAETKNLMLSISFVTVHDYMFYLRAASIALRPLGPNGMMYAAAAVSDFFVPWDEMAEHKMQSSAGPPPIKLVNSPKLLMPLRHQWCPEAYVVTFKLETDGAILEQKAKNSIDAYGMDLVIANLLHTRKDEVIYFEKVKATTILRGDAEVIEAKMIPELIARHKAFVAAKA